MTKQTILFDGDTFTHDGHTFIVSVDHGAPWKEEDGHGPVSEWTSRDKKPGEWVLSSDRGSKRFYDAAEATRIAKRDSWGLTDEEKAKLATKLGRTATKGEVTAEAVRLDFEHLRGWANDKYLTETAHELADECGRAIESESFCKNGEAYMLFAKRGDAIPLTGALPFGVTVIHV